MTEVSPETPIEPRILGRYALFDEIAAGGMATVHLGRLVGHVGFSRIVAVKRLHPQYSKDQDFVAMFEDEARLASRIQHPNVVSTIDVVKTRDELFVVMEFVQGEPLSKLVRNAARRGERIPPNIVTSVMAGMLHGLHAAHEAKSETREPLNLVHRDISPQNVLVGVDGVARVLDFGVAKAALRSGATREGQMKGKLSYMSPEQLNGKEVDRRTDIFAAGIVAWEAVAGKRLFAGADAGEILGKVLSTDIPTPQSIVPTLPDALNNVVMKALERDPDARFQTAREFAVALEQSGPLATTHTVGEWVKEYGGEELAKRGNLVTEVESYPMEDLEDRRSGIENLARRAADSETTMDYGTRQESRPEENQFRRKLVLGLLLVAVGMLGGWVIINTFFRQEPAAEAARRAGSVESKASDPVAGGAADVAQDPGVSKATALGSVGDTALGGASASTDVRGNPVGAGHTGETSVPAEAGSSGTALRNPGTWSSHARNPGSQRGKDCSVPYTIDANGIKIPKPQCLKN